MEDRSVGNSSATKHEDRSVWVVTAYAVSGLVLVGVLAYYFSSFVSH